MSIDISTNTGSLLGEVPAGFVPRGSILWLTLSKFMGNYLQRSDFHNATALGILKADFPRYKPEILVRGKKVTVKLFPLEEKEGPWVWVINTEEPCRYYTDQQDRFQHECTSKTNLLP